MYAAGTISYQNVCHMPVVAGVKTAVGAVPRGLLAGGAGLLRLSSLPIPIYRFLRFHKAGYIKGKNISAYMFRQLTLDKKDRLIIAGAEVDYHYVSRQKAPFRQSIFFLYQQTAI